MSLALTAPPRLRGLGACADISTMQAKYGVPGCEITYNPMLDANGNPVNGTGPCQMRAWCTSAAASTALPPAPTALTSGWDVHILDATNAAQAASDANWQVNNGIPVLPQTSEVLRITGQPIPTTASATPTATAAAASVDTSWFSSGTDILGFEIPNLALAAAGGALLLLLLAKGKHH